MQNAERSLNVVKFCSCCGKELTCRRGAFHGNCFNCGRPEAELVQTIHGVYVCATKDCARARVGTAAAPRPFVCVTCRKGDVEGKDDVLLDAK